MGRVTNKAGGGKGKTVAQDDTGRKLPQLPHEQDESDHSQDSPPRKDIEQAYDDVQSGKEDTDLTGTRGRRTKSVPPNRP